MNKTEKPSIRFRGFEDAWEQRKIGAVANVYDGVHQTPAYTDSGIMFLSAEDISTLKSEKYISEEAFDRGFKVYPQKGDVFMTRMGDVGTPNVVETSAKIAFYVSLALLKPIGIDPYFLCSAILSPFFQSGLKERTLITAIPQKINKDEIGKVDIALPAETYEQRIIGVYFKQLGDLIILHQRKLEKLMNVKKSMLEKMFPQNGSSYPAVRFKGFTDAWERRRLGDVVQITMGQSPDGSTYSDEPSDHILVQGNADLQNGWVCPRVWTTQITRKADAGDLIMSVRAPAGAMGKTAYNAVIGRGVAAIKGNEFIYQLLVKMYSDDFWKTLSCGSTFESLNSDNIKNAEVRVPTTAEQVQIGDYFSQLDHLITLQRRELEKLQSIRKSLLEKMFG